MRVRAKLLLAGAAVLAAAGSAMAAYGLSTAEVPPPQQVATRAADIVLPNEVEETLAVVPAQGTLSAVIAEHDPAPGEATSLIDALRDQFDLRRLRAGQPYRLVQDRDGRIRAFSYEVDGDRVLEAHRLDATGDARFDVAMVDIPKETELTLVEGVVDRDKPSLVQAIEASGENVELSLAMAEVFSGEVDFNSELQPGDSFRLLVEKQVRADTGAFAGYGPVLAAELVNDGRDVRALRFTPPGGEPAYFDEKGRSLKRFFLKSPLKFEPRITSSFSRARRHPILHYTRAHNGVDYAAPPGAPVGSVAAGVVTFAGWTNGGGRTVKVRHAGGYESQYLHMSAIAKGITRGAHVEQGQLVGRVGSTGLATGPHLHYGLKLDGRYVNPVLEQRKMPPAEPVPAAYLALFETERDRLFGRLFSTDTSRADN